MDRFGLIYLCAMFEDAQWTWRMYRLVIWFSIAWFIGGVAFGLLLAKWLS